MMPSRSFVWNQAGLTANRYRTYRPVKPVGELPPVLRNMTPLERETGHTSTCKACGYHMCSCSQVRKDDYARETGQGPGLEGTIRSTPEVRARLLDGSFPYNQKIKTSIPLSAPRERFMQEAAEVAHLILKQVPGGHWLWGIDFQELCKLVETKLSNTPTGQKPVWKHGELEELLPDGHPKKPKCLTCGRHRTQLAGRVCADQYSCEQAYSDRQNRGGMTAGEYMESTRRDVGHFARAMAMKRAEEQAMERLRRTLG